jgi:hypothetical protein
MIISSSTPAGRCRGRNPGVGLFLYSTTPLWAIPPLSLYSLWLWICWPRTGVCLAWLLHMLGSAIHGLYDL